MGLIFDTFRNFLPQQVASVVVQPFMSGRPQYPEANYQTYAKEGYSKTAIVYACIEELATSAAEPRMQQRRGKEWALEGAVVDLLKRPNSFMDGFELWATVIMHLSIAGNAYGLKVRSRSGRVVELWLLRPDRIRIVPSTENYIDHYEYDIGGGRVARIPENDVIHWKKRNPLNDFYGMPPLMAASGATDLENYMKAFVTAFFTNAGVPGGLLNVEGSIEPLAVEEIRNRFQGHSGPKGWHSLMIIEGKKASFTPMTSTLGPSGLVVPELGDMTDAEICSVFGVPQSLVGTRLSYSHGGYANKQAEEEHFWTGTLAPLYKEISGPLNLRLVPEFASVDEVGFDLNDVRALQEDLDKVHARIRGDLMAGVITIEEARAHLGWPEKATQGTFLLPANLTAVPAKQVAAGTADTTQNSPSLNGNGNGRQPIPAR